MLAAYIDNQKTLLARTHADIEKLKQLRGEAGHPGDGLPVGARVLVARRLLAQRRPQTRLGGENILALDSYEPCRAFEIDWQTFSACGEPVVWSVHRR